MTFVRQRRIVFVNHTGQVSGAETILLHMLRGLDRERFTPAVVCPEEGDLARAVRAEGVQCVPIPALQARFTARPDRLLRYLSSMAGVVGGLRKTIRSLEPDIVHANTVRAGIAVTLATAGTGLTVLWHAHDILPRHPLSSAIRTLAFLSPRTRIIGVSQAAARAFCGALPFKDRVQVIYNGADLTRFPTKKAGDAPLKRELGISPDSFLVCAVGQICERKGLRELVEAFAHCDTASPPMHLAFAGKPLFAHDQRYYEELLVQVKAAGLQGRVHFLGQRRDVPAILRSADLLVLNSLEEPFGLVLVEAMASGTAVLASRVGGIPEIVTDSQNGWLVDKGNTSRLAAKLQELSHDPDMLARVSRVALESTCPRFSLTQFHAQLRLFYERLEQELFAGRHAQPDRALEMQ